MLRKVSRKFYLLIPVFILAISWLALVVFRVFKENSRCANTLSCKESLEFSVRKNKLAVFNGVEIIPPEVNLAKLQSATNILGEATESGEKRIEVDLTTQTLRAYEGDTLFMEARTATGKWFPTPTGEFSVWHKVRSTLMSGGSGADYYYLPNVEFVMFFYNSEIAQSRGFAVHGAYWHNNFGHAMSHGCINLRNIDAEKLYYWADPPTMDRKSVTAKKGEGTKIIIYGKAS